ncbi:hypothetical protein GCM10027418_04210 [Mariniluteicoccus endophyticus]
MPDREPLVEELDAAESRWEPPVWLAPLVVLVAAVVALAVLVVPPAMRWLAPVVVTQQQLGAVFEPRLTVGETSWAWPYQDRAGTLGAGFCEGAMAQTFAPVEQIWVAESEKDSGVVFSGAFADGPAAQDAYETLVDRYEGCGAEWLKVTASGEREIDGAVLRGFSIESVGRFRFQTLRRELRFVRYGNTVAIFVGERVPADDDLAAAWRGGVRRAAGR